MKIILRITFLSMLLVAIACGKDDNEVAIVEPEKSSAKEMLSFTFNTSQNENLDSVIMATVSEASKTAVTHVPNGTDISNLTPEITISEKASISPLGEQDFRTPVNYTITAEDGSTSNYRASVIIMASDAKQIISFIFDSNLNETIEVNALGEINEESNTVVVEVPFGTEITDLIPTIEIPENASVDPSGAVDFSEPVNFTVTAEDDTTVSYMVSVNILERENSAPLDFELISPTLNGPNAGISVTPTLTWNASPDPDGDSVTYDIYLNIEGAEEELYAEDISATNYAIVERLQLSESYVWRVVAKDPQGATTTSATSNFSTRDIRFTWVNKTSTNKFPARAIHSSVVFNNRMWAIGGFGNGTNNDVWYSFDGNIWKLSTDQAAFGQRRNHTSVVFDNKMWVIGGTDNQNNLKNDVWFSEDGENWTLATGNAAFSSRWIHSSVVFDGKIWVIGGLDAENRKNDVWFSEDGINWTEATGAAPFTARQDHTTVVFNDRIWVIGGFDNRRKDDVWSSADGINWSQVSSGGSFGARENHTSVIFDNKIWVIGGRDPDFKSDIWSSEDGVTWKEITNQASFGSVSSHTSVVFDNKVWIIGGSDGEVKDFAWSFE